MQLYLVVNVQTGIIISGVVKVRALFACKKKYFSCDSGHLKHPDILCVFRRLP